MKRFLVLLLLPSCSLIANPDDHLGGSSVDTGVRIDGGGVDAEVADGGHDAGDDAGPPPPECASAAECGTGPVDCVASRCVFCAAPLAAPVVIDSDTELVRQFGMAVGNDGAASEVLLAYIPGGGTSSLRPLVAFIRTSAVSPVEPGGSGNALNGIEMISSARFDTIDSLDVSSAYFDASRGSFGVSVLGTDDTSTVRTYVVTETDTFVTSGTYPGADTVAAPAADLAPLRMADMESFFSLAVYRARLADGSIVLRSVETSYGNAQGEWAVPSLPTDPYAPIAVAHGLVAVGTTDAKVALWDLDADAGVLIDTPGRTGAPGIVEVATGGYVLAYGAGSRIVLRAIECTGPSSTCAALTSSLEIETGAASIPRVELTRSGDVVALVSYEAAAGGVGGQLALRAVRSDLSRAYHATTGDALTLESFPGGSARLITDVHHELATPPSGDRYVIGWMRAAGTAGAIVDLRLQSIGTTCM